MRNHSDMVMYLTVNDKTKEVAVTFDKKDAKPFSVKTVNETLHRHELEFSLTSTLSKIKPPVPRRPSGLLPPPPPPPTTDSDSVPLEHMLEVSVNPITGKGGGVPVMRLTSNYKRTRILLKKRSNHKISCDTKDWIKGTEAYYIQCIHALGNVFFCVTRINLPNTEGEAPAFEQARAPEPQRDNYKLCVKGIGSSHSHEKISSAPRAAVNFQGLKFKLLLGFLEFSFTDLVVYIHVYSFHWNGLLSASYSPAMPLAL